MEERISAYGLTSQRLRHGAATAGTSTCPSSPSSGGESPTNPTSTLAFPRKPFSKTPGKALRKQRSADDLQKRGGLWPSAKNQPGAIKTKVIAATLQDHLINDDDKNEDVEQVEETHDASTFFSRDSSAYDNDISDALRGRRYRRSPLSSSTSKKEKKKKYPGTPPSPSSSSSSGSATRLLLNGENELARRTSESDRKDVGRNSRSRASNKVTGKVIMRSGSPVRTSKSPVLRNSRSPPVLHNSRSPVLRGPRSPAKGIIGGGMGNIISVGLGSLFRRNSFSGAGLTVPMETTTNGLSARRGMAESAASPAREAQASPELHHKLRMAHNQLMQWRFVNGRMVLLSTNKQATAQKALVGALVGLLDLQVAVTQKRLQLARRKLSLNLKTLISPQLIKALERWGDVEKHHMAAISSIKNCLHAVVCRLPLTDRAKADPQILLILLRKATNLMAAINGNIEACNSMARATVPLVAKLAQVVAGEKPLIEECSELLDLVSTLQFREESLRCQLIQLRSWK